MPKDVEELSAASAGSTAVPFAPYYEDELVTIYNADCRSVLPYLSDIGALITDPPYSSGGMVRSDRQQKTAAKYQRSGIRPLDEFTGDNRDQRAYCSWVADWTSLALSSCSPSGLCFLFTDWRQLPTTTDAIQWGGWVWRGLVTWHKPSGRRLQNRFASDAEYVVWGSNGSMPFDLDSAAGPSSVITADAPRGGQRVHIAQKPPAVIRHLLPLTAGVVLDPFMGSGTTLVACKLDGRKAVGIEINEGYCEAAANRLRQGVLF